MPSGVELLNHTDHMNPTAYGSPQGALFAGNMGPSFMDPFGNIHSNAAATDPYTAPALFAPNPGAPAAYLYQAPAAQPVANPADEIRTVFVSGFPHDVKERELHNLLRFMPGYEASQMNWKTGGPQGFALFNSSVHARAVVEILSGLQFDDGVVIRAEMAHKNMFIKVRFAVAGGKQPTKILWRCCLTAPGSHASSLTTAWLTWFPASSLLF